MSETNTNLPDALILAMHLEASATLRYPNMVAAYELRRLHAENTDIRAQLEAVGAGGVGAMVPNEVESRELILQHAVMDSVQLMNGCVMTSPTLQKAHELLRQSLWDYSEAVSGTRKATDHSTLLVRALRSLEDTEKCHGSTTRRTVLMADIRSATIASAQPAQRTSVADLYG